MQFWPSLRMNNIHKDWSERWPSFRSRWDDLRLTLNGRRLRGEMGNGRLRFENAPVRRGLNELTIGLRRGGGRAPLKPVRVQGVEVFIDYRT